MLTQRLGVIHNRSPDGVVVIERLFGDAASQAPVAIVDQVDQDAVRVSGRSVASLLPMSSGPHQRDLEQILRISAVSGQQVSAAKQPLRPRRDELVKGGVYLKAPPAGVRIAHILLNADER